MRQSKTYTATQAATQLPFFTVEAGDLTRLITGRASELRLWCFLALRVSEMREISGRRRPLLLLSAVLVSCFPQGTLASTMTAS